MRKIDIIHNIFGKTTAEIALKVGFSSQRSLERHAVDGSHCHCKSILINV
ncbi:MAG: hypothetical protein HC763_17805 [Hydrococcus sp. CRU_1_1]|nr:hypothetical protein [Hydrococcus sp. CRU_1_1]